MRLKVEDIMLQRVLESARVLSRSSLAWGSLTGQKTRPKSGQSEIRIMWPRPLTLLSLLLFLLLFLPCPLPSFFLFFLFSVFSFFVLFYFLYTLTHTVKHFC